MQKITPFLWFNNNAEDALDFYCSIFKDAEITSVARYGDAGPGPKGSLMTASFRLGNQEFVALNGGSEFSFNPSISFFIECNTQEEIDYYWNNLLQDGGQTMACGWLRDKFGLTWQVVPSILPKMISDKDPQKADRVMRKMMSMIKFDIAELQEAYDGKAPVSPGA